MDAATAWSCLKPLTITRGVPPHSGLQERQHAFGAIPGLKPGMHTGLKHFAPLQVTGAVGANFAAYLLGPFMATWRSRPMTWSGAKQVGQHWPGRRLITKGASQRMSAQPFISPHASPLSVPLSSPASGYCCRMSSDWTSEGTKRAERTSRPAAKATKPSAKTAQRMILAGGGGKLRGWGRETLSRR